MRQNISSCAYGRCTSAFTASHRRNPPRISAAAHAPNARVTTRSGSPEPSLDNACTLSRGALHPHPRTSRVVSQANRKCTPCGPPRAAAAPYLIARLVVRRQLKVRLSRTCPGSRL